MGIVHEVVERDRLSGGLDIYQGIERFVIQVFRPDHLPVAPLKPLIFGERDHHDACRAMPLDADRPLHRFVGVKAEAVGDVLGGHFEERF